MLSNKEISGRDSRHTQRVWNKFNIKIKGEHVISITT